MGQSEQRGGGVLPTTALSCGAVRPHRYRHAGARKKPKETSTQPPVLPAVGSQTFLHTPAKNASPGTKPPSQTDKRLGQQVSELPPPQGGDPAPTGPEPGTAMQAESSQEGPGVIAVCICVCVRARDRERKKESEREREKQRERCFCAPPRHKGVLRGVWRLKVPLS